MHNVSYSNKIPGILSERPIHLLTYVPSFELIGCMDLALA
jgi:hypothetical protein